MAVWEVGDHFIFQEKDLKWNMPIYSGRPSLHMQFIGLMYNKSILDWSNVHKQLPLIALDMIQIGLGQQTNVSSIKKKMD